MSFSFRSCPPETGASCVRPRLGNPNTLLPRRLIQACRLGNNPRMVVATGFELVGRENELVRLDGFVRDLSVGAAGVVISGDAGIGKTALWRAAVDLAEAAGLRVLATRCAEAEMPLALGAVGDLLETALAEVADELAEPQRRALAIVLGLEAPPDEAPDPSALPRAFLACLRTLARRSPVVVAIDDVQWLDAPSQRILAFAARRLGDAPVGILVTQRGDLGDPLDLGHALAEGVAEIRVGPLSVGALHHLIRTRLGLRIPRPTIARVHQASGGNPMFALEFAQVAASSAGPLPLPSSLEELVRDRVAGLPLTVLPLLEAVAAAERPTTAVLARAVEEGDLALDEAIAAGAVALGPDGIVRFTHPLLASAVYDAIPPARRAAVHTRLANASSDIEERARHLALATREPDVEVARLLDGAAAHARARGAPDAAAELAEQAVRLTPPSDCEARENRMLAAAEFLIEFDVAASTRVLDELLGAGVSGPLRAQALLLRWAVEPDAEPAGRFAREALEHAEGDRGLRARALLVLSRHAVNLDDPATSVSLAHRGLVEAEHVHDPGLLAEALAATALRSAAAGHPEPAFADRALALAAEHRSLGGSFKFVTHVVALERMLGGNLPDARTLLEESLDAAVRGGWERDSWATLTVLIRLELEAGNWEAAERYYQAAAELVDANSRWEEGSTAALAGLIASLRGRVADARRLSSEAIRHGESLHFPSLVTTGRAVLGFLELSLGEPAEAWRTFSEPPAVLERRFPTFGFHEPMPNAVEALVALGRLDDAEALLTRFDARWPDHGWAMPARLRCRALLLLARRELEAAVAAAEEAVVASEVLGLPLERGRALLAAGEALRRLGQRRRAGDKLDAAKQGFVELGAPLWVGRAERELSRARPRPRRDGELTSAERGVAALVAAGRTNREVAAELFTTVGTVEVHLTRIYRKLGLRSRTELARQVAEGTLDISDS
jgi:DNA-binding CsgD family transcriptional regulator